MKNNAGAVFPRGICLPEICEELSREVVSIGIALSNTSLMCCITGEPRQRRWRRKPLQLIGI